MPKHIPLNTNIKSKNNVFTLNIYGEILQIIDNHANTFHISRSELMRLILTDYLRECGIQILSEDFITKTPQSLSGPERKKAIPGKRNEVKIVLPMPLAIKFDNYAKQTGKSKSVIMSYAINLFFNRLGVRFDAPVLHL